MMSCPARQQAGLSGYGDDVSTWDAFWQVKEDAKAANATNPLLSGYYLGYLENIIYAYPADVIKFIAYEQFSGGRKSLPPVEGAMVGAAATAVAQFVTTPLDVVRNRIMAQKEQTTNDEATNDRKKGYLEMLVQLGRKEGLSGLFAGATPRVGKAALSGAIQFATYEETKQQIAKAFQNRQ